MTIFPTQYSVLSAKGIKTYLEENYSFGNISCKLIIHNVSDTYIAESKDEKYIF